MVIHVDILVLNAFSTKNSHNVFSLQQVCNTSKRLLLQGDSSHFRQITSRTMRAIESQLTQLSFQEPQKLFYEMHDEICTRAREQMFIAAYR